MTSTTIRWCGIAAALTAAAGLLVAPLHALARYATADGSSDLESGLVRAWAEPATEAAGPLVTFASADTVYLTYGKFWPLALAAVLACAIAVRSQRPAATSAAERWGWRLSLSGYALAALGTFLSYWTPLLDQGYIFVGVPGMLLAVIGSTILGAVFVRRAAGPAATRWLLLLMLPLQVSISLVGSAGMSTLPLLAAWGIAGLRLWRHGAGDPIWHDRTRRGPEVLSPA